MLVQRVTIYANYGKSSINVGAEQGKSVINGGVKRREPVAKRGENFILLPGNENSVIDLGVRRGEKTKTIKR